MNSVKFRATQVKVGVFGVLFDALADLENLSVNIAVGIRRQRREAKSSYYQADLESAAQQKLERGW